MNVYSKQNRSNVGIMFFGKHFASMYTGSMVGAGFGAYALMGYVIGNQQPNREGEFEIELNSTVLGTVFGETEGAVSKAIEYLCAPDPKSRSKKEDGRRLIRIGEYSYRVVNGAVYKRIRDEEERREQNRLAQQRFRRKVKPTPPGTQAERDFVAAHGNGEADSLPRVPADGDGWGT